MQVPSRSRKGATSWPLFAFAVSVPLGFAIAAVLAGRSFLETDTAYSQALAIVGYCVAVGGLGFSLFDADRTPVPSRPALLGLSTTGLGLGVAAASFASNKALTGFAFLAMAIAVAVVYAARRRHPKSPRQQRTIGLRLRELALSVSAPWLLVLTVMAAGAAVVDSLALRILSAVLAVSAAVVGYVHAQASPYKFTSEDWREGTVFADGPNGVDRDVWELTVPQIWHRDRVARVCIVNGANELQDLGPVATIAYRADGAMRISIGRSTEDQRYAGEVRFGG